MTVSYKGAKAVEILGYSFRQDDGVHYTYNYRGIPGDVISIANEKKDLGFDTSVRHDGPYTELTASRPAAYDNNQYAYTELWSVSCEILERSLFTLPSAMAEAATLSATHGGLAGYKKKIEQSVSEKAGLDTDIFPAGTFPWAHKIYAEMLRGVQGWEAEYTILNRTVNFNFQSPPGDLQLQSNRYIYQTSDLPTIPATIKFQLPADSPGTEETQTKWGWRIREQSAEVTNATTGQHRTSWVYAQWSTFLYKVWGT